MKLCIVRKTLSKFPQNVRKYRKGGKSINYATKFKLRGELLCGIHINWARVFASSLAKFLNFGESIFVYLLKDN